MSRAKAINEKCKECIYDASQKGTWRQQVAACTSFTCSLRPFRPMPKAPVKVHTTDKT